MNAPPSAEPVIDAHGWRRLDEVLPANLQVVLVWNVNDNSTQFAEFRMYSEKRYEFLQGSHAMSIHDVTHWQPQPAGPVEFES